MRYRRARHGSGPRLAFRLPRWPCDTPISLQIGAPRPMTPTSQRFTAGPLAFVIKHELWDGNIHDHADQGVSIAVAADVAGKETALLRFNCFDQEKSYVYGPENPDLTIEGPTALAGVYRMDPIADGNP